MDEKKVKDGAIGCGLLLVLFVGGAILCPSDPDEGSNGADRYESDKVDAWIAAQDFVTDQLAAPSTASFGSLFSGNAQSSQDVVESMGQGRYRVSAWVDSQNRLGATIRSHFVCEIERSAGSWRCTRLDFFTR